MWISVENWFFFSVWEVNSGVTIINQPRATRLYFEVTDNMIIFYQEACLNPIKEIINIEKCKWDIP